jgi:hypothetical protein
MELPTWASFLGVVLATVLLLKAVPRRSRRVYNLPPGPKPWTIIGNLNLVGALPHRSILALSQKYGPLMQLQFGSFPVVVGSSVEMAKFFLHPRRGVHGPAQDRRRQVHHLQLPRHHLVALRRVLAPGPQDVPHRALQRQAARVVRVHPRRGGTRAAARPARRLPPLEAPSCSRTTCLP